MKSAVTTMTRSHPTTTQSLSHYEFPRTGKRGVPQQFPRRLYEMLDGETRRNKISSSDNEDVIISWSTSGKAFRIYDVKGFASTILPKYFRTTKFSSFQRNLNLYGFTKARRGADSDMYAHPSFIRDRPDLLIELRKVTHQSTPSPDVVQRTLPTKDDSVRVSAFTSINVDFGCDITRNDVMMSNIPAALKKTKKIHTLHTKQPSLSRVPPARSVSPAMSYQTGGSASSSPQYSPVTVAQDAASSGLTVADHHRPPAIVFPRILNSETSFAGQEQQRDNCSSWVGTKQLLQSPRLVRVPHLSSPVPNRINRIPWDDHEKINTASVSRGTCAAAVPHFASSTKTDRGNLDLLAFVLEYECIKSSSSCR